jgi:hypothetical protein
MANPMPTEPPDGEKMTVLTPTTFPSRLKLGLQNYPVYWRIDLDEIIIAVDVDMAAGSTCTGGSRNRVRPQPLLAARTR